MIQNEIFSISCPIAERKLQNCPWIKREGSVRDFPDVGLVECINCHLVTHEKDLSKSINYEKGTMHLWASGSGENLDSPTRDIERRVKAISKLAKEYRIESILDFGSGSGEILDVLREKFRIKGLEPEYEVRIKCQDRGHQVASRIEQYTESAETFDMVTLFHVVEHFYKPDYELSAIYTLLAPGGILVVETPNSQDALLTLYDSEPFSNFTYWSHHPMLHSATSLIGLISKSGLKIIQNTGVQRYGLANHLFWLSKGLPGGHMQWNKLISDSTEKAYEESLVLNGVSDTIWVVAQKPKAE